jgi:predicted Rossmann fold nucleotide-binding protein DprA/Smf involved in DNA uptake
MNLTVIGPDSPDYPSRLRAAPSIGPPPAIAAVGNPDLLNAGSLALIGSIKYPGDVILKTYEVICALRAAEIPVISGFHSPMEKECLAWLLRGSQPVLICLGRSLRGMRIPSAWRQPLAAGRLLILSCFERKHHRLTADTARLGNRYAAALADQVLVAYAAPGSRTERFCRELTAARKPVWAIASSENAHLVALGARPLTPDGIAEVQEIAGQALTAPATGVTPAGRHAIVL